MNVKSFLRKASIDSSFAFSILRCFKRCIPRLLSLKLAAPRKKNEIRNAINKKKIIKATSGMSASLNFVNPMV
jgi:hypothetical protein